MRSNSLLAAGILSPLLLLLFLLPLTASAQALVFDEIAIEFTGGLGFLDPDVRPAIDENGTVAFAGDDPLGNEKLFVGNGGALTTIHLDAGGYSDVTSVQVNAAGHLVWTSDRMGTQLMQGAYRSNTSGSFSMILEEGPVFFDPADPYVGSNIAMSPNGTVAYSTIVNGNGALHRHAVVGASAVLRSGSGTFYNTLRLDVNDAGEVPVQMEYSDPTLGLARGILIFDSPGRLLAAIDTAVEKMGIGEQPRPAINASGAVAFSTNSTTSMTFYDPPDDSNGTVVAVVSITPGIYIATPTAFGQPSVLTQRVDTSTGFSSFGPDVLLNDQGTVVFSASKTFGGSGIYQGPDPVADKILEQGDTMDGRLFSIVKLGELNNAGQLTLLTSDFFSTDRQIWRVSNVPEPNTALMLLTGAATLRWFQRRTVPAGRRELRARGGRPGRGVASARTSNRTKQRGPVSFSCDETS